MKGVRWHRAHTKLAAYTLLNLYTHTNTYIFLHIHTYTHTAGFSIFVIEQMRAGHSWQSFESACKDMMKLRGEHCTNSTECSAYWKIYKAVRGKA